MKRDTWIWNVMKIHPEKTKEETEELYDKIFPARSSHDSGIQSDSEELSKDEKTGETN